VELQSRPSFLNIAIYLPHKMPTVAQHHHSEGLT
jgi:hypothetical protein